MLKDAADDISKVSLALRMTKCPVVASLIKLFEERANSRLNVGLSDQAKEEMAGEGSHDIGLSMKDEARRVMISVLTSSTTQGPTQDSWIFSEHRSMSLLFKNQSEDDLAKAE